MPEPTPKSRFDRIDALRGLAMVWMAVYHFCFDLNHFKLIAPQDFYNDPLWTWQRTCIVSSRARAAILRRSCQPRAVC